MVLPEAALDGFDTVLQERGYTREADVDVSNIYDGRIVQYGKPVGENAVEFDALVNALRCRQTNAEWSYEYLEEHSVVRELNVAPDLSARIPEPTLLFRDQTPQRSDRGHRDLFVISSEADFADLDQHLDRGNRNAFEGQIEGILDRLQSEAFEDSFKGVFEQRTLPEAAIDELVALLRSRLEHS